MDHSTNPIFLRDGPGGTVVLDQVPGHGYYYFGSAPNYFGHTLAILRLSNLYFGGAHSCSELFWELGLGFPRAKLTWWSGWDRRLRILLLSHFGKWSFYALGGLVASTSILPNPAKFLPGGSTLWSPSSARSSLQGSRSWGGAGSRCMNNKVKGNGRTSYRRYWLLRPEPGNSNVRIWARNLKHFQDNFTRFRGSIFYQKDNYQNSKPWGHRQVPGVKVQGCVLCCDGRVQPVWHCWGQLPLPTGQNCHGWTLWVQGSLVLRKIGPSNLCHQTNIPKSILQPPPNKQKKGAETLESEPELMSSGPCPIWDNPISNPSAKHFGATWSINSIVQSKIKLLRMISVTPSRTPPAWVAQVGVCEKAFELLQKHLHCFKFEASGWWNCEPGLSKKHLKECSM